MSAIDDLQKKLRLESERDAVLRAISNEISRKERTALQRVLGKIEQELAEHVLKFPEAPRGVPVPALPDSSYREPMPSERIRLKRSRYEGA